MNIMGSSTVQYSIFSLKRTVRVAKDTILHYLVQIYVYEE